MAAKKKDKRGTRVRPKSKNAKNMGVTKKRAPLPKPKPATDKMFDGIVASADDALAKQQFDIAEERYVDAYRIGKELKKSADDMRPVRRGLWEALNGKRDWQ